MIKYDSISNPGARTVNEDYLGGVKFYGNNYCFCLADGLGGHQCGEEASAAAVGVCLNSMKKKEYSLERIFTAAQNEVLMLQQTSGLDMKTTMVILTILEDKVSYGHIGDSRVYHFKKGELFYRTKDHSVPQMLVAMGEITADEIRFHPDRNRLLSVIGEVWERPRYTIDALDIPLEEEDSFLLCSDGFWEYIDEKEMIETLKQSTDVKSWLKKMTNIVEMNNMNVNADNYSAIAVMCKKR